MIVILSLLAAFVVSWGMTWIARDYAIRRNLFDTPNDRSSHNVPTPRGGGLSIVIAFSGALVILSSLGYGEVTIMWAYLGGGLLVALIGFIDDHGHVPAGLRLLCHFGAAAWLLYFFLPDLPWIVTLFAAVSSVWLLNLFNFMDGIDGIAGVEAATVGIGGIILSLIVDAPEAHRIGPLLLVAATLGFLYWNFPKARIFMGDAGSGFIGLLLGAFVLHAATVSMGLFWGWVILLGVFVIDATTTLLQRLVRGERIYEAHRSHAYQRAARRFQSHTKVTIATGIINVLWLFPLAALAAITPNYGVWITCIAWFPLLMIAIYFGAGKTESR